ncbi:hypothetical protein B0J11DRAFT_58133 [Dendryphion nanum]|uniref:Rhodopsin domain-containing protein n=1 Tax=Dendryphion nanum TaxID=256645 RepID=A0A9P9IJ36_9PLEO|nr:hypothetical protein B0J11DRAFT_58133 [Dendryphion nanum]
MSGPPPFGAGPPDPNMIPAPPSAAAFELSKAMKGVSIGMNVLCFMLFMGRLWTRNVPVFRMGADDYVISVSYVLIVVDTALLLLTMPYMFGKDPAKVTLQDSMNAQRYALLSQPIWAWAMAGIKISVILMILRLQTAKLWRRFCWGLIGFVLLLTTYNLIAQLTQCIPLHKTWDLLGVVPGKCWGADAIRANLYAIAVLNFTTDFIIALLPITFLTKVQRPLRERIIIGMLMGLGVFAGVASIIKMVFAAQFGKTGDYDLDGIRVGMWSLIEETVGFTAACIPCLRSPFQKCLEYFGLASTRGKTAYGRGYGQMYGESGMNAGRSNLSKQQASAIRMKSMRSADAASEENILPSGVESKNGEIWCTTEVEVGEESRGDTPKIANSKEGEMGRNQKSWIDERADSR